MAAIAGKAEFMEPFDMAGTLRLPQIGTFNGHPVAAAAGIAMMKTLLAEGGMAPAMRHGEQLKAGIAVRNVWILFFLFDPFQILVQTGARLDLVDLQSCEPYTAPIGTRRRFCKMPVCPIKSLARQLCSTSSSLTTKL